VRFVVLVAIALGIASAQAGEPRKIDFTKPLLDVTGKPLKENGETVTVGLAVAICLAKQTGAPPSYWFLGQRVLNNPAAELTTNEIHAITTCVSKTSPLVSGQVDLLVDPTFKPQQIQ